MSDETPPLIRAKDLFEIIRIPILAVMSWTIPERHWDSIAHGIARLTACLLVGRTRSRWQRRTHMFDDRIAPSTLDCIETKIIAHGYVARMQVFREYRPGGWRPGIQVVGAEHIEAALAEGQGAVLWVAPFAYSHLVTKKGLHEAGYWVSHLSRPSHGFSSTRFGIRVLNPIWTRIEDRYLAERVRLRDSNGSESALVILRDRLKENRVVTITVGDQARKTVRVAFLGSRLRLATGPVHLARTSKAALLPVFTVRTGTGILVVNIESPLSRPTEGNSDEPYEAVIRHYVQQLEQYILEYPNQWNQEWGLE